MTKNISIILVITLLSGSFFLGKLSTKSNDHQPNLITDTIFINRPYKVIEYKEIIKPKKIFIYKTDTITRTLIEKDTLITYFKLSNQLAEIHTITPSGIPQIKTFEIPNSFKSLQLDHEGDLNIKYKKRKRNKLWRNIERVTLVGLGALIGSRLN